MFIRVGLAFAFLVLFLSGAAYAQSYTGWTKVKEVGCIDTSDSCFVSFETSLVGANPASCSETLFARWEGANPMADRFLSLLMTARSSGRDVNVLMNGGACLFNSPRVRAIHFR